MQERKKQLAVNSQSMSSPRNHLNPRIISCTIEKDDFKGKSTKLDITSETAGKENRDKGLIEGNDKRDAPKGECQESELIIKNAGQRLYALGAVNARLKQQRLDSIREEKLTKELSEVSTKPIITPRARSKPAKGCMFAEHSDEWKRKKEERLETIIEMVQNEREKELTLSPSINERSSMIAEYIGYQGPISGWYDHFAKYYAKINSAQCHNISSETFSPNINHVYCSNEGWHSVDDLSFNRTSISSDCKKVSAFERLFDESFIRSDRKKEKLERKMNDELTDQSTSRPFFSPVCLPRQYTENDLTPEEHSFRLHALNAERSKNKEEFHWKNECSFAPKLNPKSKELSERRRKPLYYIKKAYSPQNSDHPAGSNIYSPQKTGDLNGSWESIKGVGTSDRSPDSGRAAEKRKGNPKASEDFLKRIERFDAIKKDRLLKIRQEAEAYETRDCTFKPAVNRRSMELFFQLNQYGNELKINPSLSKNQGPGTNSGVSQTLDVTVNNFGKGASNTFSSSPAPYSSRHTDRSIGTPFSPNAMPSSISTYRYIPCSDRDRSLRNYSVGQVAPNENEYFDPNMSLTSSLSGTEDVNDYVNNFEKEMFSVLDEWRKLDDA